MKVKCISKNRNEKGVIINYTLQDEKGNTLNATAQQIKSEMKAGNHEFINLQIDKAGRLVDKAEDKAEEKPVQKKPVQKKPVQKVPSVRQLSTEEKKERLKLELNEYIELLKKKYKDEDDGAEKFLKDLSGEGNIEYVENKGFIEVCHMTLGLKKYFNKLIKLIEDMALKSDVRATKYDYFSAILPEPVQKFMESSGCDNCIAEAMFYQASKNSKLALVKCGLESMSEGFVGAMILTANYDKARQFMIEEIENEAEDWGYTPKDILDRNFVEGDNMLGHVFVLKLLAEIQKHDVEYYKKQVLEIAQTTDYMCDPSNPARNIRYILSTRTCGKSYLALKLGILPARDDWDTEEEKEREDKIKAEAERLASERQ